MSDFRIWEGQMAEFPKNDRGVEGFDDTTIVARNASKLVQEIAAVNRGEPVMDISVTHQYPLPAIVAMMAHKPIHILDFGGGLGRAYLAVKTAVKCWQNISFHILELPHLAKVGREVFGDDAHVHFITHFQQAPKEVDIIHAGSAFQYVEDWESMLATFAGYQPEIIAFGNLLAGDIEPVVTIQNYWGARIPVRFHRLSDVAAVLAEHGYAPIYDTFHEQIIIGQRQPLPLAHFPVESRLRYGRNIIFRRSGAVA